MSLIDRPQLVYLHQIHEEPDIDLRSREMFDRLAWCLL